MTDYITREYEYSREDILGGRLPRGAYISREYWDHRLQVKGNNPDSSTYRTAIGDVSYDSVLSASALVCEPVLGEGLYKLPEPNNFNLEQLFLYYAGRWYFVDTKDEDLPPCDRINFDSVGKLVPVGAHKKADSAKETSQPLTELIAVNSTDIYGYDVTAYCSSTDSETSLTLRKMIWGDWSQTFRVPNSPKLRVETDEYDNSTLMVPIPIRKLRVAKDSSDE